MNLSKRSLKALLITAIIFLYIFVVAGNPITALANAAHDDALFLAALKTY